MKARGEIAVQKPRKILVPLVQGLAWLEEAGIVYQEKMDGRFEIRHLDYPEILGGETILAGEKVGAEFYAFDCLKFYGVDYQDCPLRARLAALHQALSDRVTIGGEIIMRGIFSARNGGELLQYVLKNGGEGVVRKRLDSLWGEPMEACKRLETFYCVVTGFNAGKSVRLERLLNFAMDPGALAAYRSGRTQACGSVSLGGGKADRVRLGSIVKIEGFGLTRAGQIREPRPCRDTPDSWLVRY